LHEFFRWRSKTTASDRFDEFANSRFQFRDAAECAAPNPFVGEFGEPSLDQIQP
jgi:hypothetical protein